MHSTCRFAALKSLNKKYYTIFIVVCRDKVPIYFNYVQENVNFMCNASMNGGHSLAIWPIMYE